MTERATVKAKIRISHKLFMFYSSWSSVSSRLQPSRSYQERMTSFYSATHSLIGFHDSAQDADNTQTAPAFVVCTRNCKIRITCDRGIVTQEKKHSIVFPATAPDVIGIQFAGAIRALAIEPHSTGLENFIEYHVAGKSSTQVREKVWLSRRNYVPARDQTLVTNRSRPKGCRYVNCLVNFHRYRIVHVS